MKDDPQRFPVGYIVARAAEGVDWAGVDSPADGTPKRRKISVFFENFVRDSRGASLEAVVAAQRREIASLKSRLDSLAGLASRIATLEAHAAVVRSDLANQWRTP